MSSLIKSQVSELLTKLKESSITSLVEGKEKNELINSAKKRGILIEGSKDLGVLKTTYLFCNTPNDNADLVPSKEFKKIFPQIIGKPMDYNHQREVILGFYIDYKYILKEDKAIAYAIFFKSNYPKLWKKAKELQKKGKLSSSFEIWSPENKRKIRKDGITELYDMTIAGGALIFEENGVVPAFKDCKVLTMAKKQMEECVDGKCLACASKYKDSDIITAGDIYKEEVEKNLKELNEKKEEVKVEEKKLEVKVEESKVEVIEPKVEIPKEPELIIVPKIKCSNCEEEFEVISGQLEYKCPKCFSILDTKGVVKFPPQLKDFRLACPNCGLNNWLILKNEENKTTLKCQNEICNKQYEIEFAQEVKNELLDKTRFLYTNTISCIQCGNPINISGTSQVKIHEVKCPKCKLIFNYNVTRANKDRQIIKIIEIEIENKKSKEQGGDEEVKIPKEIVDKVKEEEKKVEKKVEVKVEEKVVEKLKETVQPKIEEKKVEVPKVEEKLEVKASKEIIPKKSSEVKTFVDLVREENDLLEAERGKGKGKNGKPQGDGGADSCVCPKCGYKVSHKKGEPCNETKCPKCKTALVGKTKKSKENKSKKSVVRKAVKKIMDLKKDLRTAKKEKDEKENTLKIAIKKVASQLIKAYAEIKKIKEEANKKIELYKTNAKTIFKRREELGEKFVGDLSDKDILDNGKFKTASLEKEVTLLKASKEKTDEIVGDKTDEDENSEDIKLAKEINARAFTKKEKE